MKIQWTDRSNSGIRNHLEINGLLMGWVSPDVSGTGFSVHCMWMREPDDLRVKDGLLYPTQYPEDTNFETFAKARTALRNSARVIYISGWRGEA